MGDKFKKNTKGFTIIELLIVMGVFAIMFSLVVLNLSRTQSTSSLDADSSTLIAQIKEQQLKAMTGTVGTGFSSPQPYGIYFPASGGNSTSYVIFERSVYNPVPSPTNTDVSVTLHPNVVVSNITLTNNSILFNVTSGEVSGYISGSDSFTIKDTNTQKQKTITINKYGSITVVNN